MRQTIFTLLLACSWSLLCYAQTPYDSFAPQAYRPMLELEGPNPQPDTIFSAVVADLENLMLLLMNVHNGEILAAIPFSDDVSKWLSVDPLSDKYPGISPYAYAAWNPIKFVDPDGRDWYETEGGSITWTNYKSQQAMDKAKLAGRYLGEAVVSFNGYYEEALGKGNNLWGEGAKLATATVYGPGGSNDIATYDAFTMSSNYNEYGAIKNGDYSLNYVEATGPMGTHWTINNREAVDCINDYNTAWYKHKETNPYSATQKNRTYVHRCNLNGDMLQLGKDGQYHPLSTGCLIIAPSRNGKSGWNEFNNQLQGIKKAFLRLTRQ